MAAIPPGEGPPKIPEELTSPKSQTSEIQEHEESSGLLDPDALESAEDLSPTEQQQQATKSSLISMEEQLAQVRTDQQRRVQAATTATPESAEPAAVQPPVTTPGSTPADPQSTPGEAILSADTGSSPTQQQESDKLVASGKAQQKVAADQVSDQQKEAVEQAAKPQVSMPAGGQQPPKVTAGEEGEKEENTDKIKASGAGAQQKKEDKPGEPAGDKTFGLSWEELGKESYAILGEIPGVKKAMALVDKVLHAAVKTLDTAYNRSPLGKLSNMLGEGLGKGYNKVSGALEKVNAALDRAIERAPSGSTPPSPSTTADSTVSSSTPSLAKPLEDVEKQSKAMQLGGESLTAANPSHEPVLTEFDSAVGEAPSLKDQAKKPEEPVVQAQNEEQTVEVGRGRSPSRGPS